MKPVYIVSPFKNTGTFLLRGMQVGHALRKQGVKVRFCRPSAVPRIKDSLLLFVKFCASDRAGRARQNGNRIIWDVLDGGISRDIGTSSVPVDSVIFSTALQQADFARCFPQSVVSRVIYHHIDTRLSRFLRPERQSTSFDMAYIGLLNNLGEIAGTPGLFERLS